MTLSHPESNLNKSGDANPVNYGRSIICNRPLLETKCLIGTCEAVAQTSSLLEGGNCAKNPMSPLSTKNTKKDEDGRRNGSQDLFSQDAQLLLSNSFSPETGLSLNPDPEIQENRGHGQRRQNRKTWGSIFLGQVLSGILCGGAICSVYLTDVYHIHCPNAQNFAFYISLATVFTTILACRTADRNLFPVLRMRGWKYAIVALADAEANFLVVKSYQFTSLTSVQLLNCFTIPTVLSFSWLVLKIRYKVAHILGVSICLLGVCCLVWADIEEGRPLGHGKDRFLGDMLCLSGAFLYGIANVAEEFVVKTFDIVEFLGMLGLFGSFVSGLQTVLLEYGELTSAEWGGISGTPVILLMAFAAAQLSFYVLAALVMKLAGATMYNLSILTASFYSLIVGIYLFQYKFHALYFLSFLLVMSGVIVFSIKPTEIASHVYRSLTREHTTTMDLELMAATPTSVDNCPSGFPLGVGTTAGMTRSLLDASPTSSCDNNCSNLVQTNFPCASGGSCDRDFLSSQSCDVVMQTGSLNRRSERYKDTRQMYETNGNYPPIPEDEVC